MIGAASLIVCDQLAACQIEAGDLILAAASKDFVWSRAIELGTIVAASKPSPSQTSGVRIVKPVGLALEDVALGWRIVERARAAGRGLPLPI